MKKREDMTLDEWFKQDYDLNVAIFGEKQAKVFLQQDMVRYKALKKLWIQKGFRTLGEFEAWEFSHMKEKNEFLRKELC